MCMNGPNLQMQSTRQQILEYLQRHGRGTVKELGELLDLTSTGIRQHLTVLERDGLVEVHDFVKKKTVLVRPGQTYLALKPS